MTFLADDPLFTNIGVDVVGSAEPIPGDAELLRIVFQNLLINAAQAVEGRGSLAVTFGGDHQSQLVRIADAGPGMSPEVRRNLFRPVFHHQSTRHRARPSNGEAAGRATRRFDLGRINVRCRDDGHRVAPWRGDGCRSRLKNDRSDTGTSSRI